MPYKDHNVRRRKACERSRRYRARRHAERYGENAGNMSGKHGNHATGSRNGRFNRGTLKSSHGYILVRVKKDHPLAFGPPGLRGAYAYEHDLIEMEMLGRNLRADEVVHHRNGNRADNRPENLEVTTRSHHAREHADHPGARDESGRFTPDVRHGPEERSFHSEAIDA